MTTESIRNGETTLLNNIVLTYVYLCGYTTPRCLVAG